MRDQRQRQLAQATSLDEQQRLGKKLKPTAAGWRAADRRWTRLKRTGAADALTGEPDVAGNASDEVKLAVDLIMLLESHQIPAQTVLSALEIVRRIMQTS